MDRLVAIGIGIIELPFICARMSMCQTLLNKVEFVQKFIFRGIIYLG